MSAQPMHRFTVEDYHRLGETGILRSKQVELLNGQVMAMMPIGPLHAGVAKRLNKLFGQFAQERWLMSVLNPVRLDNYSEPQPDLMLLKPSADDYISRHPGPTDVFLLIEIADSSLIYDRDMKLPLYGRAGIPEVWIVNLPEQVIEVYRESNDTGYGSVNRRHAGAEAQPLAFPDIAVEVKTLLAHPK